MSNTEVGRVSLGLELQSRPAEQQAKEAASKIENTFNHTAAKIGKTLAAAFSVKAIASFSKKCLELGSDLAEVQNVVDSTFGRGSKAQKAINDFAQNAAKQFGLSETMAKRYAGTFGAMSKAFGFTDDAAAEMSTTLTGLAGDVASFYNISQDEAYTKLKSVFTGETESLKDLGVVMTQSALDQFALANGFGRTTSAMSEQEKVALRYRFVMDKLSTASGDFARTSGGWANQVRLLKLQFDSLCATIGEVLIQALTPAIQALNAFMGALIKAANTFKSFVFSLFGKNSEDLQAGSAATTASLAGMTAGAEDAAEGIGDVGDAASGTGKDVSDAAKKIQRSLASFDKITKLTDQSASGSGSVSGSGSGSGGGGGSAGGLGDTSSALPNSAYDAGDDAGPLAKIAEKLKGIKDLFVNGFWEGFGDTKVLDSIRTHIDNIKSSLDKIFGNEKSMKAFSDWFDSLVTLFGRVSGAAASIVATVVDNLLGGMDKWLTKHGDDISKWWQELLGTWTKINNKAGELVTAIADIFSVFRSDEAKSCTASIISILFTPISNVVTLVSKFAATWLENVVKIIEDNKEKIKTALEGSIGRAATILDTIDNTVTKVWKNVQKLWDEHIKPLLDTVGDTVSGVLGILLDGWNKDISPVLDKLSKKFKEVMEDHVDPMLDSLNELLGSIFDLLKKIWEKILDPLFKWIAENVMPTLKPIVEFIGEKLLDKLQEVADGLKAIFDTAKKVVDKVTEIIDKFDLFDGKKANGEVGVKKSSEWNADAWNVLGLIFAPEAAALVTIETALKKASSWASDAWTAIQGAGKTLEATITAKITEVKDEIKTKMISFTANLTSWKNSLEEKMINFTANLTSWKNSIEDKMISFTANLTSWKNSLEEKMINFTANLTSWKNSIEDKMISFTANLTSWKNSIEDRVISFKADLTSWKSSIKSKVINFTANLTSWKSSIKSRLINFKANLTSWQNSIENRVINFKANLTSWVSSFRTKVINFKANLTSWISSLDPNNKILSFKAKLTSWMTDFQNWYSDRKITFTASLTSWIDNLKNKVISFAANIVGNEKGGVYRGGRWRPVQSYAGGGNPPGGQIFRARENGNPELVGTIKGSTAVMNNDQIVASVSHGVAQAIAGLQFYSQDRATPHLAMVSDMIRGDTSELARYAQQAAEASRGGSTKEILDVLREILKFLQTADFDVYLDGKSVKDRIVALINADTQATGRSAIIV